MSDTADSTLNALKALIAAFQTGATPVTVKSLHRGSRQFTAEVSRAG